MSILKLRVTAVPPVGLDGSTVLGTNLSNQQVDENFLSLNERKLAKSGGTMTGFIVLHADPSSAMHPATKQSSEAAAAAAVATHAVAGTGHAATAVSVAPTGAIAATNVQTALAELDAEKVALAGGTMTGALTLVGAPTVPLHAATKAYVDSSLPVLSAATVTVTPAGNIAATNVQTALEELDNEKQTTLGYPPVNLNGDTMLGHLNTYMEPTSSTHAAAKYYVDMAALFLGQMNPVVNGCFQVWSRGTNYAGSSVTRTRTADCWWARVLVGSGTWSVARVIVQEYEQGGYGSGKWALKLQRPNGNGGLGALQIANSIETIVAEAWSKSTTLMTISVKLKKGANYSGGAVRVYVRMGTGTDQNILDVYTGQYTLLDWSITPTDTYDTYTNQFWTDPSMTEMGVIVQFTPTGTAGVDDAIYISDVRIAKGIFDIADNRPVLPFVEVPFDIELMRCMRYYENSFPYGNEPAQNSSNYYPLPCYVGGAISTGYVPVMFSVPKRSYSAGVMTTFNPGAASNTIRNITRNTNGSTMTSQLLTSNNFFVMSYNQPSGTVAGDILGIGWEYKDNNF